MFGHFSKIIKKLAIFHQVIELQYTVVAASVDRILELFASCVKLITFIVIFRIGLQSAKITELKTMKKEI